MDSIEQKIEQLEKKIITEEKKSEAKLLIKEMKKIGIEKLPYSYTALKKFIDAETMNFHYNKHYKGYVDKLNDALAKKKSGDVELEEIIKNISRYDQGIRNNAGGAFNHALFWNMLSPKPMKLKGDLYNKISKEFGTFTKFKKKFEQIAKDRFGSGWVWLVLNGKNNLKIMSTPNQDNPLMNVVEGGGFPLLGLDLWEHAYYLKYKNKRDEYITNFWDVVNWDFVSNLYDMKIKTKLIESVEFQKKVGESSFANFCDKSESVYFQSIINDEEMKEIYSKGVEEILKSIFGHHWVESTKDEMAGFYGVESIEGRSVLNNFNTNYNIFCLLEKMINKLILEKKQPEKVFDFKKDERRNPKEVARFIRAMNFFKDKIFDKSNREFINLIKVGLLTWKRGVKTENKTAEKIKNYFEDNVRIIQTSGHGKKLDAYKGIDMEIILDGKKHKSQVKPFSGIEIEDDVITVLDSGNVEKYNFVDWLIFRDPKKGKVLIFKNNPISSGQNYKFKKESLLHEIE